MEDSLDVCSVDAPNSYSRDIDSLDDNRLEDCFGAGCADYCFGVCS